MLSSQLDNLKFKTWQHRSRCCDVGNYNTNVIKWKQINTFLCIWSTPEKSSISNTRTKNHCSNFILCCLNFDINLLFLLKKPAYQYW